MGNLLLVDDEPDILESLVEMFQYESGLDIGVYSAKSASKALRLLEKIKFDVVMTDIKMPGMSGIELYRQIKENWPKCRMIFLTGYRDFDNLYEISGFKDVRYLLKSEENEILISTVKEEFEAIEKMMLSEEQENQHQIEIRRAQIILQRNVMRDYFRKAGLDKLDQKELERIHFPLNSEKELFIFLMSLDYKEENSRYEEEIEREKFFDEVIEEFLPPRFRYYLYDDGNGNYLLFFQPVHFQEEVISARMWKNLYANLAGAMEYVQEKIYLLSSISVSFITCNERCYLKEGQIYLNRLKQFAAGKARDSVQRFILAESGPDYFDTEISANFQIQVKELEHALELEQYEKFSKCLQSLTAMLVKMGREADERGTELYYSIAIVLLRFMNLNHIKDKISHDFPLDKLISIDLHADMEEASIYLNMVAGNIIDEMNTKKKSRINEVLERVIEYINNHLAEDLTLTHLAEISYLNASYLSRVFKQEYQLNITEYIGKVRLEKAKTLLSGTACKINEIASQVGYLSVPSFNRVFKKAMGISPLEYRMKYGDKNNEI